jgi:hypothetical protein
MRGSPFPRLRLFAVPMKPSDGFFRPRGALRVEEAGQSYSRSTRATAGSRCPSSVPVVPGDLPADGVPVGEDHVRAMDRMDFTWTKALVHGPRGVQGKERIKGLVVLAQCSPLQRQAVGRSRGTGWKIWVGSFLRHRSKGRRFGRLADHPGDRVFTPDAEGLRAFGGGDPLSARQ